MLQKAGGFRSLAFSAVIQTLMTHSVNLNRHTLVHRILKTLITIACQNMSDRAQPLDIGEFVLNVAIELETMLITYGWTY